jgi:Ca2+-dependent lipid-binding protein
MTRITRSGARSGPISPARSQRRGGVRREQRASTSTAAQQEVEGTEEEEEEASQDTPLEAPLSQLSVQANSVQADLSQCGACLDWFHKDGRSGNHQETASLQSQKALATVPEEHAEHQRLSELGGVGYVFEQCHKGLCSG